MKYLYTIKKIEDSCIETKQKKICLIEIMPINFLLKSLREQEIILDAYKSFLKQCNFDMQIFVQTTNVDMREHLIEIDKCINYENDIYEMANAYKKLICEFSSVQKSMTRRFFVVIQEKYLEQMIRALQTLKVCGNDFMIPTKEECIEIYKQCYKNFDSFTNYNFENTQDETQKIYPSYFEDKNPNFLKVNDKYVTSLVITDFPKEVPPAFFYNVFSQEVNLLFSMFYEKQNSSEVLKRITYSIGNAGSEIKNTNDSQTDFDILGTTYNDAKYIRKKMQLEQEDLYNLYCYISVASESKENLEKNIQKIEAVLNGLNIKTRRALYRQKEVFESSIPILKNVEDLKKYTKRNVLTEGLSATYPFLSNELIDKNGVLVGINENDMSLIMIDRFDTAKYKNSNMCIIGTSGSGKSYFTKLMALRNRYLGVSQYVIDPEREYIKVCKKLNGTIINFEENKRVNVFDIRKNSAVEGCGYLQSKLSKLNTFFSLIFKDLTQEEINLLEEKVIRCYEEKGITFDDESLFYKENRAKLITSKRFKKAEDMPILEDLYKLVKTDKRLERIKVLMKPYVYGSEAYFNGYTNVDLENKFVVADLYGLEEISMSAMMFVLTEFFWDIIRASRNERKIIYMDEVWRLIGTNEKTAKFVYEIFKTIRKYGGGVTAITQDIDDFFALEEGRYGRGILNNSSIKAVFQLEENEINVLKENLMLSEEEVIKIQNSKRGNCLLYAGGNHIEAKVIASQNEHQYITTDIKNKGELV